MNESANKDLKSHDNLYVYRVLEIYPLTEFISQLFLQPETHALFYTAGQYVNVIHSNNVSPLSIACSPREDKNLEFHLYHSPENDYANELLRVANEDKTWTLQGPFGSCTSDKLQTNLPIIFLAFNTGFAPIKAVIEALITSTSMPIHLYWTVPRHHHFYLQSLLKTWEAKFQFKFTLVVRNKFSQENKSLHELAVMDHPNLSDFQVYASGPRPFVQGALQYFLEHGLMRSRFYSDVV